MILKEKHLKHETNAVTEVLHGDHLWHIWHIHMTNCLLILLMLGIYFIYIYIAVGKTGMNIKAFCEHVLQFSWLNIEIVGSLIIWV